MCRRVSAVKVKTNPYIKIYFPEYHKIMSGKAMTVTTKLILEPIITLTKLVSLIKVLKLYSISVLIDLTVIIFNAHVILTFRYNSIQI